MASPSFIPVGGYTNVTQVISAAAQTAVLAEVDKLLALIPDPTVGGGGVAPFYDAFRPEIAAALRLEIAALKAAIDAAPTA